MSFKFTSAAAMAGRILFAVSRITVLQNPLQWAGIISLGAVSRALVVACFVATIQALLLVALPDGGGSIGRLLGPVGEDRENIVYVAIGLVVLLYGLQLLVQSAYQRLLGMAILAAEAAMEGGATNKKLVPTGRKISVAACTATGKAGEILLFQLFLAVAIALFDWRLLVIFVSCAVLIFPLFLFIGGGHVWRGKSAASARQALASCAPEAVTSCAMDFRAAEEEFRYRKQLGPAMEGMVIGTFTALIILGIVLLNLRFSETFLPVFFMVFALRYAIVYVRELARALTALFDLRAEQLLYMAQGKL